VRIDHLSRLPGEL